MKAGICRTSTIKNMSAKLAACQSHRKAAKGLDWVRPAGSTSRWVNSGAWGLLRCNYLVLLASDCVWSRQQDPVGLFRAQMRCPIWSWWNCSRLLLQADMSTLGTETPDSHKDTPLATFHQHLLFQGANSRSEKPPTKQWHWFHLPTFDLFFVVVVFSFCFISLFFAVCRWVSGWKKGQFHSFKWIKQQTDQSKVCG